jgi:hypothetical protein
VAPAFPAGLPADFNDDDMVDLTDYAVLRDHFRQAVADFSQGDANRDGFVDFRDFRIWKDNRTDNGAAVVPEPMTAWMAVIATGALCGRCRRPFRSAGQIRSLANGLAHRSLRQRRKSLADRA